MDNECFGARLWRRVIECRFREENRGWTSKAGHDQHEVGESFNKWSSGFSDHIQLKSLGTAVKFSFGTTYCARMCFFQLLFQTCLVEIS